MSHQIRRRLAIFAAIALVITGGFVLRPAPRVFLIGDSTMADKPLIGNPERGWGQALPLFFTEDLSVENHARNGRSTKSFIHEGRWNAVLDRLHPGDYVFIQFGHNDAKRDDSTRFAAPHTDYKQNLLRFIRETRAKDGIPVLITPVCRRRFDSTGTFYDVHGDYPLVVREIAETEHVPLIDLQQKSKKLLEELGAEKSKALFLWIKPGTFSAIPNGKRDDTHFCWKGASKMAELVVEGIKEARLPLVEFLKPEGPGRFEGIGKTVLLDNFYNNEWRSDSSGRSARFHYVWHDTTNSGFSQLGEIISRIGASLDTICQAPTTDVLKPASVYIIVDPDTPKETTSPNVLNPQDVDAIVSWVTQGGVLLLLGNDKGNAEFQHFNMLATRFGIRFNEDSRNRVVGKDFAMGMFDAFPDHPLFKGLRKIYIKELSTLDVKEPATSIFSDGKDVIIAHARLGRGSVVAVGDPWFYDEYMDHRRLPDDYDNARAAENMFRWLLAQAAPASME